MTCARGSKKSGGGPGPPAQEAGTPQPETAVPEPDSLSFELWELSGKSWAGVCTWAPSSCLPRGCEAWRPEGMVLPLPFPGCLVPVAIRVAHGCGLPAQGSCHRFASESPAPNRPAPKPYEQSPVCCCVRTPFGGRFQFYLPLKSIPIAGPAKGEGMGTAGPQGAERPLWASETDLPHPRPSAHGQERPHILGGEVSSGLRAFCLHPTPAFLHILRGYGVWGVTGKG